MKLLFGQGQQIQIKGVDFTVQGVIEFREDDFTWQEYMLVDNYGEERWLSVEKEHGWTKYSIYQVTEDTTTYESFRNIESGTAVVVRRGGYVDVQVGDKVQYREGVNKTNTVFFATEKWDDCTEYSFGEPIYESDLVIRNRVDGQEEPEFSNDEILEHTIGQKFTGCISAISHIFIVLVALYTVIAIVYMFLSDGKEMSHYIKNSNSFTYVTSITSNTSSKKAKVYSTDYTVPEAVIQIIKGSKGEISQVTDEEDLLTDNQGEDQDEEYEDGVGLKSRDEYAYVYTSSDGITYVQISSKKYVGESQGNAYHSRTHRNHYYHIYRSNTHSKIFTNISRSVRQNSTRTRRSSGGGTSHGK